MGKPNHPLLEDSLAPLRQEADRTTQALAGFRQRLEAMVGGTGGATAGASAGAVAAGGAQARQAEDQTKRFVKGVKDLQQAINAAGPLAKKLGFDQAAVQIEKVALAMNVAATAARGLAAASNVIAVAWRPVALAVGASAAAVIALQRVLEVATGQTHTLGNTVRLFGLGVAESLANAKGAFFALKGFIEGNPLGYSKEIADAQAEVMGFKETIREIQAQGKDAAPWQGWDAELKRLKADLADLANEVGGAIGDLLGAGQTRERPKDTASTVNQVGQGVGVELARGVGEGLNQGMDQVEADFISRFMNKSLKQMLKDDPLAIFQSVIGLWTSGANAARSYSTLGRADGGQITPGGAPSLAHFLHPIGRAFGGMFGRPPGLDPSDVVPLWGAVGEFMQPVRAVKKYGLGVMESFRNLTFPVDVAQAFSSGIAIPATTIPTTSPRGYAEGGSIAGVRPQGDAILPVLPVTATTMEMLLHGGGGGDVLLQFLQKNGIGR